MLFQSSSPDGPVLVSFSIAFLSLTLSLLECVCYVCVSDFVFCTSKNQSQIFIVFIIKQNMKLKTWSIGPFLSPPSSKMLASLNSQQSLRSTSQVAAHNVGDSGLIPGWGRSPGGGNGNPLQYSCLENFMDRGAQRCTVHRVAKSRTRLNDSY